MNLLLEARVVSPACSLDLSGGGYALVLLDMCSFCRDTMLYHNKSSV